MLLYKSIIVCLFGILIPISAYAGNTKTTTGNTPRSWSKVDIQVFYEAFCPESRQFITEHLAPTVDALAPYIDLHVNPYGNAETINHKNGTYEFKCQHGPTECYGNRLHACAIHTLGDIIDGTIFNACMMEFTNDNHGSDDKAADECANTFNLDAKPIKKCAKGPRGTALLIHLGIQSKKQTLPYVPYILINGKPNSGKHFESDVCAAFEVPPPVCERLPIPYYENE